MPLCFAFGFSRRMRHWNRLWDKPFRVYSIQQILLSVIDYPFYWGFHICLVIGWFKSGIQKICFYKKWYHVNRFSATSLDLKMTFFGSNCIETICLNSIISQSMMYQQTIPKIYLSTHAAPSTPTISHGCSLSAGIPPWIVLHGRKTQQISTATVWLGQAESTCTRAYLHQMILINLQLKDMEWTKSLNVVLHYIKCSVLDITVFLNQYSVNPAVPIFNQM